MSAALKGQTVQITVELEPHEAAALMRLVKKLGHSDVDQFLYPHVAQSIRTDQAYHTMHATGAVEQALREAGVSDWPWIETGRTE